MCPLKRRRLIGEWVWSDRTVQGRMQKMHYLDVDEKKTKKQKKDPVSSQDPISVVYDVGSKHLFTRGRFFCFFFLPFASLSLTHTRTGNPGRIPRRLHNRVGVATPHKPRAFWHYTAQPWGQRKALSSEAQRSDFSLAPWEQRRIMNSRAPGITFGFTRVNSILERNKGAVGETFVGREQCAQGATQGESDAF